LRRATRSNLPPELIVPMRPRLPLGRGLQFCISLPDDFDAVKSWPLPTECTLRRFARNANVCRARPRLLGSAQEQRVPGEESMTSRILQSLFAIALAFIASPASAQDPLRIGLSLSVTGPTSPAGKQVLAGLEIWRDDVNAKGGLLGRKVELVYYDDQGNPAN